MKAELERVLIVRLSALGDIVHALPVLAALKRDWPAAKVDWLVEDAYAPILALAEGLNRRIIVRASRSVSEPGVVAFGGVFGFLQAIGYLRRQRYDAALDLQGLIKSAVWARSSGAKRVIGFHRTNLREPQAAMFYSEMIHPVTTQHVIQKNLMVLDNLGSVAGPAVMPLRAKTASPVDTAIKNAGGAKKYIVINPGAAWPNKRWPPERFGELASALKQKTGLPSFVTWGPKERELADSVVAASHGAAIAAPPTEVADLVALMRGAALVVSGDTGPLHIAAAVGSPIVGLYGPTWPQRNGPWDVKDEVLSRAQTCKCHHKRQCQIGAPCINEIQVADVVAAAERRLSRSSPNPQAPSPL